MAYNIPFGQGTSYAQDFNAPSHTRGVNWGTPNAPAASAQSPILNRPDYQPGNSVGGGGYSPVSNTGGKGGFNLGNLAPSNISGLLSLANNPGGYLTNQVGKGALGKGNWGKLNALQSGNPYSLLSNFGGKGGKNIANIAKFAKGGIGALGGAMAFLPGGAVDQLVDYGFWQGNDSPNMGLFDSIGQGHQGSKADNFFDFDFWDPSKEDDPFAGIIDNWGGENTDSVGNVWDSDAYFDQGQFTDETGIGDPEFDPSHPDFSWSGSFDSPDSSDTSSSSDSGSDTGFDGGYGDDSDDGGDGWGSDDADSW